MKNYLFKIVLVCIFSALLLQTANSQQETNRDWQPNITQFEKYKINFYVVLSSEDRKKMETLWDEIGENLKTEKNSLAGTYIESGYESGYLLRWSTEKGFVLIPYFDQSMIADFSYGKVEITEDSETILIPEQEMSGTGRRLIKTPRVWIPVKNGEFLVYKQQIASFGDYYGGFGEFNGFPRKVLCDGCGRFARRFDDTRNKTNVSFLAPPRYLKFIKKPITAKIMFVGKRRVIKSTIASCCTFEVKASATNVLINAGSRQGVRKNLLFLLVDAGNNFNQVVKIIRTNKNSSQAVVLRVLDEKGKENYHGDIYDSKSESYNKIPFPPLRVGINVTTSALAK
jgi:hypothetical protein